MLEIASPGLFAEWDILSALNNATAWLKLVGGLFIGLIGVALIIWCVWRGASKIMGSQTAQQTSWVMIIVGFIIGGAFMVGGGTLIFDIAAGGKTTIEDFGNGGGFILLQSLLG